MKLKATVVLALVLLAQAAGEAKAQKVTITGINTKVKNQITVNVSITSPAGWKDPSRCEVQLRPPGGAAGAGVYGRAQDISAAGDGSSWAITFDKLTTGTKYDVQAIGTLNDAKFVGHFYYSATMNTTVP